MPKLTINGQEIEVQDGATVLEAAKECGVEIPTFCHHKAVPNAGACRVCVVEVTAMGRTRLTASCAYPAEDGLVVETDTERVLRSRRMTLELLLARCPEVKEVREMAQQFGVQDTRFETKDDDCIMCGLCVRVCREVIGSASICFAGRGPSRVVATPY